MKLYFDYEFVKLTSWLAMATTVDRVVNEWPTSETQWETGLLTSDEHDTDRKDLLRVGVGGHIPKADAGQTTEGEVERRHILIFDGGAWGGVSGVVFFSCSKEDTTDQYCSTVPMFHLSYQKVPIDTPRLSNQPILCSR